MFATFKTIPEQYNHDALVDDDVFLPDLDQEMSSNYFLERILPKRSPEKEGGIDSRVGKYFIHPRHMDAFTRVSLEYDAAISIRESGEDTLNALGAGAAAKGHNILEKTIKRRSLQNIYQSPQIVDDILVSAEKCGFLGRVGRWSSSGPNGIYARNNVSDDDKEYEVDINAPINHELVNTWIKRKIITPYTGDYDLHDIILFKDGRGRVPDAGGKDESAIINRINRLVSEVDPARPYENKSMNVVRHGPQVNFVPYMWKYEFEKVKKDKGYLGVVAKPGPFPIAMVYRGQWSIFENKQDLFDFYKKKNAPLPIHWAEDLVDCGGGIVLTHEHQGLLKECDS
ncbi:hypothetical protein [Aeromonas sp. SG16]|uniref:hypothetical protein n=1 Tax=Aeromonas sp. SG16 TaxID=2950548 RepID=UPI0021091C98|nr:hypothetical protein [Aeromonas sp. SG16]MCQ4054458.1 hypothetical protein [Aeromonas sp. SG16]